jgi:hypothetical protein
MAEKPIRFCELCGRPGECHHIITRGSGGDDDPSNIMILCPDHHTLGPTAFHRIGRSSFAAAYPQFADKIAAACERAGRVMRSATSSMRPTK